MLAQADEMGQPTAWLWRRGKMMEWEGGEAALRLRAGVVKAGESVQPWLGRKLTLIRGTVERRVQDASVCLCLEDACE